MAYECNFPNCDCFKMVNTPDLTDNGQPYICPLKYKRKIDPEDYPPHTKQLVKAWLKKET